MSIAGTFRVPCSRATLAFGWKRSGGPSTRLARGRAPPTRSGRRRPLVAEIGGGRIMTDCRVRVRPKVKPYLRGVLRLATAAALLYAGVAGVAQAGWAQVSAAPTSAGSASAIEKHPQFEVISIRRHTAESGPVQTGPTANGFRSEEHTSELQSLRHLVCRLLLEKKK